MFVSCAFRHQQHENQFDVFTIGRVERHGALHADNCPGRGFETLDAAMGYGNTLAEARGTEFFPREKTVENEAAGKLVVVLKKQPGLFENPFFAGQIGVEQDV